MSDLIDRQEVIRRICDDCCSGGCGIPCRDVLIVSQVPAVSDDSLAPKKPYTYYSNPPYKTLLARCPNCKRPLRPGRTYRNPDFYCPRCGQAIDWSEV